MHQLRARHVVVLGPSLSSREPTPPAATREPGRGATKAVEPTKAPEGII